MACKRAGDLQQRPGKVVHVVGVHGLRRAQSSRGAAEVWGIDQHGRAWQGVRQHFHRTVVVEREAQEVLSARVRFGERVTAVVGALLRNLQSRPSTPVHGLTIAGVGSRRSGSTAART